MVFDGFHINEPYDGHIRTASTTTRVGSHLSGETKFPRSFFASIPVWISSDIAAIVIAIARFNFVVRTAAAHELCNGAASTAFMP